MMKSLAVCLAALLPLNLMAQTYQGMSEADMKKMMQQAQQMQACMAQIDRAKADALKERSERISKELETLCAQGKRDAAQRKAIRIANRSNEALTLSERDFSPAGTVALAIARSELKPGEVTTAYLVIGAGALAHD